MSRITTSGIIKLLFILFALTNYTSSQYTEDCGVNRSYGCFTVPENCRNSDCQFVVKWQDEPNHTMFVLQTNMNSSVFDAWTAVGFSNNLQMDDTSVTMCRHSAIAMNGGIETWYNRGHNSYVLTATQPSLGLFNPKLEVFGRFLTCRFSRQKSFREWTNYANLSSPNRFHILVAAGRTDTAGNPTYHGEKKYVGPYRQDFSSLITAGPDSLTTTTTTTENPFHEATSVKKKTHACLMVFTWMFLVSTGMLLPRYYKYIFKPRQIGGKDVWFILHITMMTLVGVINLIGFLIILSELNWEWVGSDEPLEFTHSIFGIFAFGMIYIQMFIGLIRPKEDSRFRKKFVIIHRTTGLIAFVFAIVAMLLGVVISDMNLDRLGWCIVTGWLIWLIVLVLIIEIIKQTKLGANKRILAYQLSGTLRDNYQTVDSYERIFAGIKSFLFVFHLFIVTGLTISLIVLIGATNTYLF